MPVLTTVRFCKRQIPAMVALSHFPTFYHKYFNGDLVEHCIVISERVDDVVTTSE